MTENPLLKVIERMTGMAKLHGTAFCKIMWDADNEVFYFTMILPEHVTVHYREKKYD